MKKLLLPFVLLFSVCTAFSQTILIPYGSSWKYLDNGSNAGTAWRGTTFNDATWAAGNAELGYGDGDEATIVSFGRNASKKYITTYFRKTISVANVAAYGGFILSIKRDDGAVVYINGTEVFRTNMPTGTIGYTTKAPVDASDEGETAQTINLPAGQLVNGNNIIAVEMHQSNGNSTDLSFDLQLSGAGDITAPLVSSLSPADNATNVAAGTNLQITFNEPVQKGTGNIVVKESGVITQTIDVNTAAVSVSGSTVSINPSDFGNAAAVNIEINAGAFKDLSNNNYAGISSATVWNFSVFAIDNTAPVVTGFSPADNAVNVARNANLVINFSEAIQKGSGNILVQEDGITTQTIAATDAAVTVSGNSVTINGADFSFAANVFVLIETAAFTDLAGNAFAGLSDPATWNFNVQAPDLTAPLVSSYAPADNAVNVSIGSNLVLNFNEAIQKGSGNIIIKEAGLITQTIAITSSTITVSGSTVTINPTDFNSSAAVNVEISAGAFRDLAGNEFAGIAINSTWNFTTEAAAQGPQTVVAFGTSWKYLDNGTNQGTAWRNASFNDGAWASGNAQLGYGDGDEATVVSFGSNSAAKYITTYFRKTINISNPSAFTAFSGSVKRDDGIVMYVNGVEVYRNNMPTGTVSNTTLASTAASDDGGTDQLFTVSAAAFVSGNNVIAVEIHQNAGSSSDLSFDLQLIGTVPGASLLTRGPYLNSAVQDGIIIRWRSDVPTNSKVSYGLTAGSLTQSSTDNTTTTEHIVTLTGLQPNTRYYYSIGSSTQVLQGDAANYFQTAPVTGSNQKIRILAMGDMGNNSTNQVNVRNAWQAFNGTNHTDAWLLMGDNAYSNGLDAEYQSNFFNIYQGSLTKNHVLWPSPGNHDYAQSSARQADHNIPYYNIFSLPQNGQAGGVASNTEAFYSFNYGNVHFVALDSYGWEAGNTRLYDTLGPQAMWLKQDLAANTQQWTVIYFHHPPYTKGSHNSDTETELINMRQRLVPILERFKVDLVLCGHSHSYERSFLLNGHYGIESTFNAATQALSSSSAKYDGSSNSCTYIKSNTDAKNGIVYAVVGSAGQVGGSVSGYPHNAMYYSNISNGGTLYFEVENNLLSAKWLGGDGVIRDNFNIMKNVNKTTNITISAGTSATLTASWIGNYTWSTGGNTGSIEVSPTTNTSYTVTDGAGCLVDVFNVAVTNEAAKAGTGVPAQLKNDTVSIAKPLEIALAAERSIFPTLVKRGQPVNVQVELTRPVSYSIVNAGGRTVGHYTLTSAKQVPTKQLEPGVYFIKWNNSEAASRFVVTE